MEGTACCIVLPVDQRGNSLHRLHQNMFVFRLSLVGGRSLLKPEVQLKTIGVISGYLHNTHKMAYQNVKIHPQLM